MTEMTDQIAYNVSFFGVTDLCPPAGAHCDRCPQGIFGQCRRYDVYMLCAACNAKVEETGKIKPSARLMHLRPWAGASACGTVSNRAAATDSATFEGGDSGPTAVSPVEQEDEEPGLCEFNLFD